MAETAADLVEGILRRAPGRQRVLSFPIPSRSLVAIHPERLTPVLRMLHRAIHTHLTKQTGVKRGEAGGGAVALIQRLGSAANLRTYLHALVARPRLHLIRSYGVLAPNVKLRSQAVPTPAPNTSTGEGDCRYKHGKPVRMGWARLVRHRQ